MKLSTKLGICVLAFTSFFSLQAKEDTLLETQKQQAEVIIQQIKEIKAGNSNLIQTGREYTLLLWEAQANYKYLSPESKEYFTKMDDDDIASYQLQYTTPDGYFRIWYKIDGVDAVPLVDVNDNGYPDLPEVYGRYMTTAREKYIEFGLKMPYTNISNKNVYDVYIGSSLCADNVLGFTRPLSFDPVCPSYIVLRSDYSMFGGWDKPAGYTDSIAAQITGAHEFQHSCQMIYANSHMSMFLKEGCAVWSEQFVYPGEKDPFDYVGNFLRKSNLGVNYDANYEYNPQGKTGDYNLYPYGAWIYFKYLSDMYGNDIIRELYESLVPNTEIPAFDVALNKHKTSFTESTMNFFTTMLMFPSDPINKPIYFSLGDEVNSMSQIPSFEMQFSYSPHSATPISIDPKTFSATEKYLNRLSCHNYRFYTDRGATIQINPANSNDSLVLTIVQVDRKNNYNDFKITTVRAFGKLAELNFTYDKDRTDVFMQVYNYTTKYTPKLDNYATNTTSYTINYQPDANSADVENAQFTADFSLNSIVPMPATEHSIMNIDIATPAMLRYNIYDMSGKAVKSESFYSNAGSIQYNLDLNGLTTGSYFIELSNGIKTEKTNFIVK